MVEVTVKMEEQQVVDVEVKNAPPIDVHLSSGPTIQTTLAGSGPRGRPGKGIPVGGARGQVLRKASEIDYDGEWDDFDYNGLDNKPSIEGIPLVGDQTFERLRMAPMTNTEIENLLTL